MVRREIAEPKRADDLRLACAWFWFVLPLAIHCRVQRCILLVRSAMVFRTWQEAQRHIPLRMSKGAPPSFSSRMWSAYRRPGFSGALQCGSSHFLLARLITSRCHRLYSGVEYIGSVPFGAVGAVRHSAVGMVRDIGTDARLRERIGSSAPFPLSGSVTI